MSGPSTTITWQSVHHGPSSMGTAAALPSFRPHLRRAVAAGFMCRGVDVVLVAVPEHIPGWQQIATDRTRHQLQLQNPARDDCHTCCSSSNGCSSSAMWSNSTLDSTMLRAIPWSFNVAFPFGTDTADASRPQLPATDRTRQQLQIQTPVVNDVHACCCSSSVWSSSHIR